MYHVSPFTYLIEGMLGQGTFSYYNPFNADEVTSVRFSLAVGRMEINCADKELVKLEPPSGESCASYMQTFINTTGGYLTNPDATSDCEYCSARTTDQFLVSNFNIRYQHHWRNLGLVLAFTVLNVSRPFLQRYSASCSSKITF